VANEQKSSSPGRDGKGSFWEKYGADITLAILIVYVVLLAIGTFADVFKIQSILDWWIFKA